MDIHKFGAALSFLLLSLASCQNAAEPPHSASSASTQEARSSTDSTAATASGSQTQDADSGSASNAFNKFNLVTDLPAKTCKGKGAAMDGDLCVFTGSLRIILTFKVAKSGKPVTSFETLDGKVLETQKDVCAYFGKNWSTFGTDFCVFSADFSELSSEFLEYVCKAEDSTCVVDLASLVGDVIDEKKAIQESGYTAISMERSEAECKSLGSPWVFEEKRCLQKIPNRSLVGNKRLVQVVCRNLGKVFTCDPPGTCVAKSPKKAGAKAGSSQSTSQNVKEPQVDEQ